MKTFSREYFFVVSCFLALNLGHFHSPVFAGEVPVPPPLPVDVNVVNQPDVRIANKNPLPVVDKQNPAFKPFQVDRQVALRRGEAVAEAAIPPAGVDGQTAVIEHVTVAAEVPEGQRAVVYIKLGEIDHALVLTSQGVWGNRHLFRASQPIRLYSLGGGAGIAFGGVVRSATTGAASFYFIYSLGLSGRYAVDPAQAADLIGPGRNRYPDEPGAGKELTAEGVVLGGVVA